MKFYGACGFTLISDGIAYAYTCIVFYTEYLNFLFVCMEKYINGEKMGTKTNKKGHNINDFYKLSGLLQIFNEFYT